MKNLVLRTLLHLLRRLFVLRPLSCEYDEKVVGRITYTVSVCRRLFRPGLEARTQPTDFLDGNRPSHGSIYPTEGLHPRSGTASRPRRYGWTDTLLSSLGWPRLMASSTQCAQKFREHLVYELSFTLRRSQGTIGRYRASPWGVRRDRKGPRNRLRPWDGLRQ